LIVTDLDGSVYNGALPQTEGIVMATDPPTALRPPFHLMTGFHSYHPSRDALWKQFEDNFLPQQAPKSQAPRGLEVELLLSAAEAATGGHFSFTVPVAQVCRRCLGQGTTGFFGCDLCHGHGVTWQTARVVLYIHPGTRDGAVVPVSLEHLGVKNLFLNVQARVTG
jgi:hypothetical protein